MKKIIKHIGSLIERNVTLVTNFGYLSVLQVVTFAIPLITIPYLLSVLGQETYGLVVFAQSVATYFVMIINYGFNISATNYISIHRDNKAKVSEIVSSVFIIKGVLFVFSCLLLGFVLHFTNYTFNEKLLFVFTMHLCLYEWLFPVWYFQGIERMKYITIINVTSRLMFFVFIFVFIKEENHFVRVPIVNGGGNLLAVIISIYILFFKQKVVFKFVSFQTLKFYIKDSFVLFMSNVPGKLKLLSNRFILGIAVGMESVALYDIAEKIKTVFVTFLETFITVLMPNVSKTKNYKLVAASLKIILLVGISVYVSVLFGGYWLTDVDFVSYRETLYVFAIVGMLIFIQPLSHMIGINILVVNGYKKAFTNSLFISFICYVLFLSVLYFYNFLNIYSISVILLLSFVFELVYRLIICYHKKLDRWIYSVK